jgi:predicted TIM-barrel fold metal-dependent hydrolase
MIIDAHVHLFPDRLAQAIRSWFETHIWSVQYREGVDATLARLVEAGIDRVVALPYAHKPEMALALNHFTQALARQHPQVIPCCTVFPGEAGEEQLLDEAFGRDGFAGVKIHCHVMRIAPDDPRLDPVWRASAKHRKPVIIHCGKEPASPGYGLDVHTVSGADRIRRALTKHPDAIAIVPHLGADEFEAFEQLLGEFENLYLDTAMAISGYFPVNPDLELIRRNPTRILYGTDYPNLPYDWPRELAVIRGLELPPADEALVLGGNAAHLFGVTGC